MDNLQALRDQRARLKREESMLMSQLNERRQGLRVVEQKIEQMERQQGALELARELWGDGADIKMNLIRQVQKRANETKKFMSNNRTRPSVFMLNSAVQGSFPTRSTILSEHGKDGTPGSRAWWRLLNAMANIMRNDTAAKSGELTDRVNWMLKEEQERVFGDK